MKLNNLLIGFFSVMLCLILLFGGFFFWQLQEVENQVVTDLPLLLQEVDDTSQLDSLANLIKYYDEVLTMSARNYAFTGDTKWKTRYTQLVPKLGTVIKQSINRGSLEEERFFSTVDDANLKLVDMEEQALALVDQGSLDGAVKILESKEYWEQKEIYGGGLEDYISARGLKYEDEVQLSTGKIVGVASQIDKTLSLLLSMTIIFIIVVSIFSLLLIFYISPKVTKPLKKLSQIVTEVSKGNFKVQVEKSGNIDEINALTDSLDRVMTTMKLAVKDVTTKESQGKEGGGVKEKRNWLQRIRMAKDNQKVSKGKQF